MTDVEFVTRVTSLARVNYFRVWVKLSKNHAKNYPFSVIRRNQARVVVGFHKITGVRVNLSVKTDSLFEIDE